MRHSSALGLGQPLSIYGLSGILLAHVFFNMPLAARLMLAGLERIPGEYWLIGANLGMRPMSIFRFIEWPVIRGLLPGIAGLIFMLCATSFTLVLTLGGGPAASTIEVAIYQALRFDFDPPRAIALSLLQMALTAALLLALRMVAPTAAGGHGGGRKVRRFDGRGRVRQSRRTARSSSSAVLFVALPLVSVVGLRACAPISRGLSPTRWCIAHSPPVSSSRSPRASLCVIAGGGDDPRAADGACATAASLGASRIFGRRHGSATSLVLLVPPVVLGAGWFLLLRPLGDVAVFAPLLVVADQRADGAALRLPRAGTGDGDACGAHRTACRRASASAACIGCGCVDWPGLRKPLLMALSFACALSLGDLGAVALFGSQDMVTLPWLLLQPHGQLSLDRCRRACAVSRPRLPGADDCRHAGSRRERSGRHDDRD